MTTTIYPMIATAHAALKEGEQVYIVRGAGRDSVKGWVNCDPARVAEVELSIQAYSKTPEFWTLTEI